jgi:catechol 2,3-dioxygenase-like lactoylglutathione lyase family enzyme
MLSFAGQEHSMSLKLHQITPFLHVPDLEAALRWFELLGFQPEFRQANYAYVSRDGVALRVLESVQEDGAPFPPHRGFAYYVDCEDVDALYAEIAPRLHQAGVEFFALVDQAYNQREFMIRAPDGNVFVFGMAIRRKD